MKTTRTICDRCGQCIVDGGSVVQLEAGKIRDKLHQPVDMCESCTSAFVDWLKGGHPDVAAPTPTTYEIPGGVTDTRKASERPVATDPHRWPVQAAKASPRAVQQASAGR